MDTPQPLVPKGSDLATGPQVLLNRLMAQTQNTLLPTSGYSNRSFIWKDLESDSQMPIAGLLSPKNLKIRVGSGVVSARLTLARPATCCGGWQTIFQRFPTWLLPCGILLPAFHRGTRWSPATRLRGAGPWGAGHKGLTTQTPKKP